MAKTLSPEELEALIQRATAKVVMPTTEEEIDEVDRFIMALDIKPGDTLLPTTLIWYHYIQWCKRPMSYQKFCFKFSNRFQQVREMHKRTKTEKWFAGYRLDPTPFDQSLDTIHKMHEAIREERRKKIPQRKRNRHHVGQFKKTEKEE